MKAIVCVDENFGIGKNGSMLFHLPEDLKFFREKTIKKTVVMGYNTFLSLPNKKPLTDRENIVLSRKKNLKIEGAKVFLNIEMLFDYLGENTDNVFIIGGEKVYEELLDSCDTAYVTKVNANGNAQKFFPDIDKMDNWKHDGKIGEAISGSYSIEFHRYIKNKMSGD